MNKLMISRLTIAVLLTIQTVDANLCAGSDWTGWRGPNRDGWVTGFHPPDSWPKQLTKIWHVEVGTGYGTPLVTEGKVFQHARIGDDEVIWCVDRKSGSVEWRKTVPVPFRIAGGGDYHGKGPKSSPVMAAGRVFTMSITGVLSAWDAESGQLLWRRDYDAEFGRSHPNWGASTSPLVVDDRVIVHFGTDEQGSLVALNAATGKEVWQLGNDGPSYSSPLLAEIDGVRQIVEWNHRALVGVDCATGKLLWEYPFPHVGSDQNMPTPVVYKGHILLGGENRGVHDILPTHANGQWTASAVWHQESVALDMSSAVINNDLLFGFSHYDSGRIFCMNPVNGRVLWEGPPRTGQNVMFLSIPGYVVALINDGQLRVLKASADRYEQVAAWRVAEDRTWAPLVLLPDGILVKDHDVLTLWSLSADGNRSTGTSEQR